MRPILIAAAALTLGACAFAPPSIRVSGPAPVELPFRIAMDGLIVLTGRVNGAHDVDFILDTGAPVTVLIDNARTQALRLDTSGARRLGDDPAAPTGVIRAGHAIDFGRVSLSGLTAVIIPGASLPCQERFDAVGFGGVIGADLFRRFVVEVDWTARLVRLHEPEAWQAPAGFTAVALAFRDGHPYVQSTVELANGQRLPARLHLDTGMTLGLALPTGGVSPFSAPTDARPRTTCFVSAQSVALEGGSVAVELGGVRLGNVTPVYAPAKGASSTRQSGALGAAALRRQGLVIDYPRSRILIGTP